PAAAEREAEATSLAPEPVAPARPGPADSAAMPRRRAPKPPDPAWLVSEAELEALAAIKGEGTWKVGGQELKVTNLDKVLFPPVEGSGEEPVTKRELIAYFARIAPVMLPHLADRPLNLQRFPNGAG